MSSHVCKHQEIIPQAIRETISMRYHVVTRAINREFWGIDSELEHSLYVGTSWLNYHRIDICSMMLLKGMDNLAYYKR